MSGRRRFTEAEVADRKKACKKRWRDANRDERIEYQKEYRHRPHVVAKRRTPEARAKMASKRKAQRTRKRASSYERAWLELAGEIKCPS